MRRDVKLSDRIRNPRVIRIKGAEGDCSSFEFDVKPPESRRKMRRSEGNSRESRNTAGERLHLVVRSAKLKKIGNFVIYNWHGNESEGEGGWQAYLYFKSLTSYSVFCLLSVPSPSTPSRRSVFIVPMMDSRQRSTRNFRENIGKHAVLSSVDLPSGLFLAFRFPRCDECAHKLGLHEC